ncbi:ArsR/SmtB family transcription factor [Thorsellia anophelis]|uniref:Transcriptional regulator, ArsR family n=1 Tax=Thorsellia anophelis DSM 18579 TaxID=1123402 RepID=A0A1I0G272_9GAMM|nr:metalloregulator ArsR/SmtB family transcription factor [Thorsellia anophelis]SET64918.1 transcriptional regulator, ArsR family [Thorsellia anophelis DSM 18579]
MEKATDIGTSSEFFKCLSDPYRLRCVLLILKHSELCVCDLMQILCLSQPKVSRYLSDLRKCNILTSQRRGQWVYYTLDKTLPDYAVKVLSVLAHSDIPGLPECLPLERTITC